ncbi:MAG: tetratricopeptide repeat protein, partial [Acidobacteriota bacterium]|nr:tetratricopeptide repeat protein [Acidobacteriota bacterium]
MGEYEKAVSYAEEALKIAREIEHRVYEGRALEHLGSVYLSLRKYEKALEYSELALQIARRSKIPNLEANTLAGLGRIYYQLKQFDKAVTHLDQALKIQREIKDQIGIVSTLHQIAWTEIRRGNLEQARTFAEEGIKIVESLRAELGSSEFRSAYLASVSAQGVYRLYTDVLMRQHRNEPTKGFDALAVDSSERQRARSLLDLLAEAKTDLREGVAPALIERERRVAAQLNDKSQQLAQANKPEQAAALKQEISQLENDYERAQTDIRKASPQYAALTQTQPLKLTEIQAQLDADTLLLEYSLGEERSYLWAITKDSLTSYELP